MDSHISKIDLGKLPYEFNSNLIIDGTWRNVANEMAKAFAAQGAVQLINSGVPQIMIDEMFGTSKEFFALPQETKIQYAMNRNNFTDTFNNYFGYWHPQTSSTGLKGRKEMFDGLENLGSYPDDVVPQFSSKKDQLMKEFKNLSKKLLLLLGIALEMNDPWYFVNKSKHLDISDSPRAACLRILHYPPIILDNDEKLQGSIILRCKPHTDRALFTLLCQDNVGGFDIKNLDNEWVGVTPIPATIIMKIADLLEFWSKGFFHAVKHRVICPLEKTHISRYSIAYFLMPDVETVISPLQIKTTHDETVPLKEIEFYEKYKNKETLLSMQYVLDGLGKKYY